MPTPDWRYEKAASTVKAICRLLLTQLDEEQRNEAAIALNDALKLLCDAITEDKPERGDLWTPGLVKLFYARPGECDRWLELIDEPEYKPDYYGRR